MKVPLGANLEMLAYFLRLDALYSPGGMTDRPLPETWIVDIPGMKFW